MNYKARQHRIREHLEERGLDALLVTHRANLRYLCGFTGSAGVMALTPRKAAFFTDGRYTEQARAEVCGARTVVSKKPAMMEAIEWLMKLRVRTIGIEADHTTLAAARSLRKMIEKGPGKSRPRLRPMAFLVEKLRMRKEEQEVEQIRAAVLLASGVFPDAVKHITPGKTETAIAAEIEYRCRMAGAEGMSFDTLVAAGPRSALPHGVASAQPVPKGGFVILDYGVILGGYCSDMTRTVYVGHIDDRSRSIYQAVLEAQEAGIAAVRAGVTAGEVDIAARKVLERYRLSKYFTHSTGHGVGLEIHELPRLAKAEQEPLQPGTVLTIEPGVYIPGFGGVRIEDTVVVTSAGCEVLTPTSKELITIE